MAGTTEGGKKAVETTTKNPEKITPIAVEKYLKGIKLPFNKNQMLECAKKNQAPESVMGMLKKLEDKEYISPAEVAEKISQLKK